MINYRPRNHFSPSNSLDHQSYHANKYAITQCGKRSKREGCGVKIATWLRCQLENKGIEVGPIFAPFDLKGPTVIRVGLIHISTNSLTGPIDLLFIMQEPKMLTIQKS